MAEAVGFASGVITLVATAYTSCQVTYNAIRSIQDAPKHISILVSDLEDFYLVLGTLQALLNDEETSQGVTQPATSSNLSKVVTDCIAVFNGISCIVNEYQDLSKAPKSKSASRTWRRVRWTFKEKEIERMKRNLVACKVTLNMAVSVANLYNLRSTAEMTDQMSGDLTAHIHEVEQKIPAILQELEDIKIGLIAPGPSHTIEDRSGIRVDHEFALRHYLDSTASICTEIAIPGTPSLQISSMQQDTSTIAPSLFQTAASHLTLTTDPRVPLRDDSFTLIINGIEDFGAIGLRARPEHTVSQVKDMIRQQTSLLSAVFDLSNETQVLSNMERTLAGYGIEGDTRLMCSDFGLDLSWASAYVAEKHISGMHRKERFHSQSVVIGPSGSERQAVGYFIYDRM